MFPTHLSTSSDTRRGETAVIRGTVVQQKHHKVEREIFPSTLKHHADTDKGIESLSSADRIVLVQCSGPTLGFDGPYQALP